MRSSQCKFKNDDERLQYLMKQIESLSEKYRIDRNNLIKYYENIIKDLKQS